ncbi:hypothetical protein ACJRPK_02555 [Aquimarina sp. 2-A2]|uniref:hypothetical protein n=1 Tax=Aquimarina sp. 2-A2 TaxID=3382644 RepID=UPI00387F1141
MNILKNLILGAGVTLLFSACGSDDDLPEVINEEETITTVKLNFTEAGSSETKTVVWTENKKDAITLKADTNYQVSIQFLDESDPNAVDNITEEVIAEKDEHLVYFNSTVKGLSIKSAANDVIDSNGVAINITTTWQSPVTIESGIVTAFLIHEPLTKVGTERSDFGGETDIEVSFDVKVE